jgi:predicted metal-dependent hydrolase
MNKKNIVLFSLIFLGLAALFYLKFDNFLPKIASFMSKSPEKASSEPQGQENEVMEALKQKEIVVWNALQKIGITKEKCDQLREQSYDDYLTQIQKFCSSPIKLSQATIDFVRPIMQEFGLNEADITIAHWDVDSPAGSCDNLLLVNEKAFNQCSEKARRFIIAHELQHIINQDHSTRSTIRDLLPKSEPETSKLPSEHPFLQLYRFHEERADMQAAMKSKEWAENFLAFAQEYHKCFGDAIVAPTHPKYSERLNMAQALINIHTTQEIAIA